MSRGENAFFESRKGNREIVYGLGSAGQIADVQRYQWQDTGREKAQKSLDEDSQHRDAGFDGKAHGGLL